MTRIVAVGLVVLASIAGARVARAEGDPLPNGAMLTFDKFYIRENGNYVEPAEPEDARRYFNAAHCACDAADAGDEQTFAYDLRLSADTNTSRPIDVWVGSNCDDDMRRPDQCVQVDTVSDIDSVREGLVKIEIPIYEAVNVKKTGACDVARTTSTAWLMVDIDGDSSYDHWVTKAIADLDTQPDGIDVREPPIPEDITAAGTEESIVISWELPSERETDLFAFQALCATAADAAVLDEAIEALYQRTTDVCGATDPGITLTRTLLPGDAGETEVPAVPAPFARLDPAFVCGEVESGTARSLTIEGLENGTPYKVALLAIDAFGNVTGTYFSTTVTPRPVIDLWEDLNGRDSAVDGGCLLATTYGDGGPLTQALRAFRDDTLARSALGRALIDAYYATLGSLAVESLPARIAAGVLLAPLVAIALAWHHLTLPGLLALALAAWLWRRRRRAARVAAAAACAAVLAPGLAAADDFTPYWEDPSAEAAALEGPGKVRWHAGIRVGPYIPDIDLQFPRNEITMVGPYEAMFGDWYDRDGKRNDRRVYQILPMLDVDRIVWDRFGQLGVGGSIGYMQKTAYAYETGTNEDDPMRPRSTAAKNTFRLLPLAATLTYRFTYLDDRWGVPVVPYVKGGLSYYVWWMSTNGKTSSVCDVTVPAGGECPEDEDKARGGTAGVQVSAGLAIRAERIDAGAARSMRNSGIQHAGFYAEVFWARVDGFGSDTKLWVGDTTWFAGVNFEF